jgi:hypothetical protein
MEWKDVAKKEVLGEVWDSLGELQALYGENSDDDFKKELEKRILYLKQYPDKQKPIGRITVQELLSGKRVESFKMTKERINLKIIKNKGDKWLN